jgi:hypothetical protein
MGYTVSEKVIQKNRYAQKMRKKKLIEQGREQLEKELEEEGDEYVFYEDSDAEDQKVDEVDDNEPESKPEKKGDKVDKVVAPTPTKPLIPDDILKRLEKLDIIEAKLRAQEEKEELSKKEKTELARIEKKAQELAEKMYKARNTEQRGSIVRNHRARALRLAE